ncbi:MAG: Immunoglobulin I-set domain protein [Pedosphaera sp.]|nr:Immunoglobulin I-set domain protein [Pedosphaera sp.]
MTFEILNFSTNDIRNEGIDAWTGTNWPEDVAFVGGVRSHLGRHPFFSFPAIAGTIYQLRAIGTNYGDFTLRITETNVPIIVIQPADRTVLVNGSTYFSALAAGAPLDGPRFSYQWRFNGLDLPGETFPILSLDNLTTNQSGNYSVIVSNAVGGTISDVAVLKVTETISPPQLMFVGCSNGWYNFKILGDLGRLYRIESSTNLVNWSEEKSFPKDFIYPRSAYLVYFPPRERNGMVYNDTNFFSVPQSMQQKFYRTTSYVAPNEICINNLNKIRCAKDFWALEYRASLTSTPDMEELNPYIKNGVPFCPLDASKIPNNSYSIGGITINPYCKLSFGDHIHVLEAPEY